jgi:hypothetical protein
VEGWGIGIAETVPENSSCADERDGAIFDELEARINATRRLSTQNSDNEVLEGCGEVNIFYVLQPPQLLTSALNRPYKPGRGLRPGISAFPIRK